MDWIWLSGGTLAVLSLALSLRKQRSSEPRRWRVAFAVIAGLTAMGCAMAAATTADSAASFALAGVLGFATVGLSQDHLWRRYG